MPTERNRAGRPDRWRKTRRAVAREHGHGDIPGQLLFPWYLARTAEDGPQAADTAGQLRFPWVSAPVPAEEPGAADAPTAGRVSSLRRKGAST